MGTVGRGLVSLACVVGRRELAQAVTETLGNAARQCPLPRVHADALRCRGLLLEDPDLLLEAVAVYRLGPRPLPVAEALEDAAMLLGRAARVSEAQPLLEEALAIYERLDARRDVARVLATLRGLGIRKGRRGPRQRPKVGWNSLTETEHQVVQLATDGLTNARIGERLFVSRRTVETHLSHVFVKLGVASRKELALAASGHLDAT
jgi:DNA-binding CsgD family transcriptional regulator